MVKTLIRTLHVRDAVSKTFHIIDDPEKGRQIDLHVDINDIPIDVPEKYHDQILGMYGMASAIYADEILVVEEVNVSGGGNPKDLGDPAQKIWEELILEK